MRASLFARPGSTLLSALLLAVAVVGGFVWHAGATAAAYAPTPPVVGTVRLPELSQKLNELKDRNAALDATNRPRGDEINQLNEQLKQVKKELDETPQAQIQKRLDLLLRGRELEALIDTKRRLYQQASEIEVGAVLRELYLKIVAATKVFAEKNGYDLVLFNDLNPNLEEGLTSNDYTRIITGTKVIYANERLDITAALADMMNNDYAAVRSGGTPPPASPATKKK